MMTYYGAWSGDGWWYIGDGELFYTACLPTARAQAMVANALYKRKYSPEVFAHMPQWEGRAIGEDGLPASEPGDPPTFEVKREFLHCKMARCAMCGEPAKEWVDVRIKGWMCDQHKVVKVGCLSEKEEP